MRVAQVAFFPLNSPANSGRKLMRCWKDCRVGVGRLPKHWFLLKYRNTEALKCNALAEANDLGYAVRDERAGEH
jgi:hypothetical protein